MLVNIGNFIIVNLKIYRNTSEIPLSFESSKYVYTDFFKDISKFFNNTYNKCDDDKKILDMGGFDKEIILYEANKYNDNFYNENNQNFVKSSVDYNFDIYSKPIHDIHLISIDTLDNLLNKFIIVSRNLDDLENINENTELLLKNIE
jgi:hypothetical protein